MKISKIELDLEQTIESFLGHKGRLISWSKSCGPACAVYNSNMVVNDKIVWYGDIDLDKDKHILQTIAELFCIEIEIYYEHDLRIFDFEHKTKKGYNDDLKKRLKKHKPVWQTSNPGFIHDEPFEDYKERMTEVRERAIKERRIAYKFLTPRGTEWKWYNTWFYKYIYSLFSFMYLLYDIYIKYPFISATYNYSKQKEEGKNVTLLNFVWIYISKIIYEIKLRYGHKKSSKNS